MRYAILQQAFTEIVESHKSDITFLTGLETDINTETVQYPVIFLQPPANPLTFPEDSVGTDTWVIHLESHEQLSDSSTTQQKQEALDRTHQYLKDVVLQFVYTYGFENKSVTVDNITETLDFTVDGVAPFSPFIDLGDNITGWQIDFTIRDNSQADLCHLPDIFN